MMTTKAAGFHLLVSVQFLLVAAGIFINVKVGLFSLIFTLIILAVILVQLSSDKDTNWSSGWNAMTALYSVWAIYYLFEAVNPNNVMEAWNIGIVPYALLPLICAIFVPIMIRNIKDIEWLLYIWAAFTLIATAKGYWQKNHGFSERDTYFLYVLGGWRTHLIWSGIRFFSCFSDAASYGVHSAMAAVTFAITSFFVNKIWKRLFFLFIALCALYGMGISGTRSAMAVIVGGLLMMTLLAKNWKAMILSGALVSFLFCFFYYTNIGNGNVYIYKMRSAFHPTEDASYMVRVENRAKMKELMTSKPIGYGIGLSKSDRFQPKESMPYPPDSWLVSVWVETGIIGLVLYIALHGLLFAWCSYLLMFKIINRRLRGLLAAWLSMAAGFYIAAYVNDVMQYPNSIVVYTAFALCFAGPYIDQQLPQDPLTL